MDCQSVFPSRVLELSVTFECTVCSSRLRTDARWEGREIGCPDCGKKTVVPQWSTVPNWPRSAPVDGKGRAQAPRPPVEVKAAVLSPEEIEFLRGPVAKDSAATA
jgi:DNA-directed RNA polymerase subunit RPC12/RpoP